MKIAKFVLTVDENDTPVGWFKSDDGTFSPIFESKPATLEFLGNSSIDQGVEERIRKKIGDSDLSEELTTVCKLMSSLAVIRELRNQP